MIEQELLTFALNNGVGVLLGVLMYKLANDMRKENVVSINKLNEAINSLIILIEKKF